MIAHQRSTLTSSSRYNSQMIKSLFEYSCRSSDMFCLLRLPHRICLTSFSDTVHLLYYVQQWTVLSICRSPVELCAHFTEKPHLSGLILLQKKTKQKKQCSQSIQNVTETPNCKFNKDKVSFTSLRRGQHTAMREQNYLAMTIQKGFFYSIFLYFLNFIISK